MHFSRFPQSLSAFKQYLKIERSWCVRLIRITWISLATGIALLALYIYLVIQNPYNLFGEMPSLTAIQNPENDLSSEVISADGVSLGRYFRYNRSQVRYEDLPPALVRTLVISEDHRFYDHSGMDFFSYLRVVYGLVTFNPQGGGSTLTQQTAKNLFRTREEELQGEIGKLGPRFELVISKTKEWIIAVRLEQTFTKQEIITLYLNTVPFSQSTYGIKIASETYFNKKVKDLNLQEIAVLVGLLQNNSAFDPVNHPAASKRKRNQVLEKLWRHDYIASRDAYDSITKLPLQLSFRRQNHNQGLATYFRTILGNEMQIWCRENGYDLYESGLKIYTTIDSRAQLLAETAMKRHMKNLQREFEDQWGAQNPWADYQGNELTNFIPRKLRSVPRYKTLIKQFEGDSAAVMHALSEKRKMRIFTWDGEADTLFSTLDSIRYYNRFLHAGLVSIQPHTGEVRAWVGGINHKHFKFDHVKQSKRQPGSTFKAFVFAKAMEDGYSPCHKMSDVSPSINVNGKIYRAANSNGSFGDGNDYTLRQALSKSLNSVTMQLMERLRPSNIADFAHRLGINSDLDAVYSLGLGTSDVSLLEMVGAYTGFANEGIYTRPYYITRIEDRHGNILATFHPTSKQVISPETAHKMIYMLKGGVEEEEGILKGISEKVLEDNDVAGKTGTTNSASDGWYIGVTHDLITGVWVGGDERSIHFRNWKLGSGGRVALPMWSSYMESMYDHPETGIRKGLFRIDENADDFNCDLQE
jgi:penicillin-binding protein 1A